MTKKFRSASWNTALGRSVAKFARSAMRAGTKALVAAARPAAKRAARKTARKTPRPAIAAVSAAEGWTSGTAALGAASRRFRLYRPASLKLGQPAPLLVMLHGCQQDAAELAASTRMNRLAAREGFLVLYPEQDRFAHGHGCWNWYETRNGRAQAEAALIVAAVEQVVARDGADPARVAIAGLSAGAGMAALVAMRHPAGIKAVAMHSGVAPGAAHSTASALSAMVGRRKPVVEPAPDGASPLPPLLVIQGDADAVVHAANGAYAATAWADALGARALPARTVQRGRRRAMRVTDFRRAGRVVVTLCEVVGLGHAWSGGAASQAWGDAQGPDASRLIWAFAARQFRGASAL